jgi:tripeptide aminopeptidase
MSGEIINKKRLIDLFIKLSGIKSPSKNEKEIISHVVKILEKLGLDVYVDNSGKEYGSNGGNVIALYKGLAGSKRIPIFLGAHLDTVRVDGDIEPVIRRGIITNKNDYILGGDDKVAVAAILEVLRSIKENKILTGDIYLIFTVCEEIGVVGAKHVDTGRIAAKYGFVFDASGDVGTIYNQAPYQNSIDVEFKGRAAHAGIEPEKGINSIKAACLAVSKIKAGRIDKETTVNIGRISGGQARNIVPEKTSMLMEARSLDPVKLKNITESMIGAIKNASKETGTGLDYKLIREYDGFKIDPGEIPVKVSVSALKNIGITPVIAPSGGGSDINIFNSRGKRSVNLSSGMENVHTSSEYVKVKQLEKLAELIMEICKINIVRDQG